MNVAYEAATVDLDDANAIDPVPFGGVRRHNRELQPRHRDLPRSKSMLEGILGESPYQSPTDMGVNMAGLAICDDDACRDAAKMEIVRRYFAAAVDQRRTGTHLDQVQRLELLMNQVGVDANFSPARKAALLKEEATGAPAGAMVLPDGRVVTGKTSNLLGAASSLLMNALKGVSGVDEDLFVISDEVIEPICKLKKNTLHANNPRLHSDETLLALSVSSATDPRGQKSSSTTPATCAAATHSSA